MPTTTSAILVIVIFLMPGFIGSRVLSYVYPSSEGSESRNVLTAITFSSFNHAILSWLVILTWKRLWYQNLAFLSGLTFFALFVSPVVIALLFARMNDTDWGRRIRDKFRLLHPIPKAWDGFFSRGIPCFVVATLKNGRTFAGLYGSNSFASSFPAQEDLYLERLCALSPQGKIVGFAPYSIGGIIQMENVATLEFFESGQFASPKTGGTP